jgi:hypothetical protein
VDHFSALPVALLRLVFRFCLVDHLVLVSTVCRAWRQWIAHPAALPTEQYIGRWSEAMYDWLGTCGVRWSLCNDFDWIERGPWRPELITNVSMHSDNFRFSAERIAQLRGRFQPRVLNICGRTASLSDADIAVARYIFAGVHTLTASKPIHPSLLAQCTALRELHIEINGSLEWIGLIQATPNQRFRIRVRIDHAETMTGTLALATAWSALRDRLDEVQLVVRFADLHTSRTVDVAAFRQIMDLRLPVTVLYVSGTVGPPRLSPDSVPHLDQLYWGRWRAVGRANVEAFLRLYNTMYVQPRCWTGASLSIQTEL